jgi:hypothetical protein
MDNQKQMNSCCQERVREALMKAVEIAREEHVEGWNACVAQAIEALIPPAPPATQASAEETLKVLRNAAQQLDVIVRQLNYQVTVLAEASLSGETETKK